LRQSCESAEGRSQNRVADYESGSKYLQGDGEVGCTRFRDHPGVVRLCTLAYGYHVHSQNMERVSIKGFCDSLSFNALTQHPASFHALSLAQARSSAFRSNPSFVSP
jgi:hypothetical protein